MIYKRMGGRLGNQMFQYAAVRAFQNRYRPNDEIYLDFQDVYKLGTIKDGFKNSLRGFTLNEKVHFKDNMKMDFIPHMLFIFYKFLCLVLKFTDFNKKYIIKRKKLENFIYPFYHKQGLYIYTDGFKKFDNCTKKNIYFFGYFESVKYFQNISNILREEFCAPVNLDNDELLKKINNTDSVCVSVRAGDFLTDKFKKDYYVCKPQYYRDSINYLKSKNKDFTYFVFSDDIEWVNKNINLSGVNAYFEREGYNLYEKICLMTNCKNYIISNSSFSFWTQFLSYNDNKIVIAPIKWSNKSDNIDIYEDNWIKIDVDKEE